jgi:abequosyltransferase
VTVTKLDAISLSICIPTYNRAAFLKEALGSVIGQLTQNIEIVICDNASTDNTLEIVKEYERIFPNLTFFKFDVNQGAIRCFFKTIELAQGTFFWLLGSDDKIAPGSIEKIMKQINTNHELTGITFAYEGYDYDMQKKIELPRFINYDSDRVITEPEDFIKNILPYYGFLSCILFKRDLWQEISKCTPIDKLVTTDAGPYLLAYISSKIFMKYPKIIYLTHPCMYWRSGNDSFEQEFGEFKRFRFLVSGFSIIAHSLFPKNLKLKKLALKRISELDTKSYLVKLLISQPRLRIRSFALITKNFWFLPGYWKILLPILLTPRPVLKLIKKMIGNKSVLTKFLSVKGTC